MKKIKTACLILAIILAVTAVFTFVWHNRVIKPKAIEQVSRQMAVLDKKKPVSTPKPPKDEPTTLVKKANTKKSSDQSILLKPVLKAPFLFQGTPADTGKTVNGGTKVSDSFFDDAVFVGDSVSAKLNYYTTAARLTGKCLGKAKFLTAGSFSCSHALSPISRFSIHPSFQGRQVLVEDGVAQIGAKKVFILLGINEMNFVSPEEYTALYKTLVDRILIQSPDAVIYAQSITPIAQGREYRSFTNETIRVFNRQLKKCCKNYGWYYLDIYSVVADQNGYLRKEFCSDPDDMGIHFTNPGCKAWVDYLMSHAGI